MLSAIKKFFAPAPFEAEAHSLYVALVARARAPQFYQQWQVPDTVDGRFDVIALHLFLVVDALRAQATPDALECARVLTEVFVSDMDRSVREMGVTDTGTGKRVRRMAEAYYGREQAYKKGFESGSLAEAIGRNLYRGQPVDAAHLQAVESYMKATREKLATQVLTDGVVEFLD
jgi:cytochrome b pre-mRNA-processing protein 3